MGNGVSGGWPDTLSQNLKRKIDMLPCVSHSPEYTPKFAELSDDDLDCLEMIGWLINTNQAVPGDFTYAGIQELFSTAACMASMSKRQRREMIIAHMLDTTGLVGEDIKLILRTMQRFSTPTQREVGLDYARLQGFPEEP